MQVASKSPFSPFHGLQTVCEGSFSSLHGLQTVCEDPFSPFHGLQTVSEGSFSSLHAVQTLSRGVRFLLAPLARLLQEVFLPYSPTLPTAGNQLFSFVLYPDYSNPLPSVKGKSPENPKKAPFLLFPRPPHCQNPSIPPAWTQGGLATTTIPQGEKQESSPRKGGVLYFSRWRIWFYAGGLERSTSNEDQNDCTISSASFSSSLLISIRKSFSLPATQRETR